MQYQVTIVVIARELVDDVQELMHPWQHQVIINQGHDAGLCTSSTSSKLEV